MAKAKKEPMIGRKDRPTAIDYDAKISDWKVKDLLAVVSAQVVEQLKYTPVPENLKPERLKPEVWKPEKEIHKPEKELRKPEKEIIKPEKERLKPEKEIFKPEKERLKPELSKPEKEFEISDLVERVATRVVELLQKKGRAR